MNIAILTNLYPPFSRGGAEYLTHQLAETLQKMGHQVSVITTAPGRAKGFNKFDLTEEDGVKVYRFTPFNFYYYLKGYNKPWLLRLMWQIINLWSPRVRTILLNFFKAHKPDLVISSNLMGFGFGAVRAIKKLKLQHVHILHDVQLLQPSGLFAWNKNKDSLLEKIYQFFTKRLFNKTDVVVSPSIWLMREHETRRFFVKSFRQILPNPIPLRQAIKDKKEMNEYLKELLYVGQAAKHKGVSWLIKTLQRSGLNGWRLRLILWADKADKENINHLIKNDNRFEILTDLSQAEVDNYIAGSYLLIMPSLCCENYPTVIVKALSLGRPVLASRSGGVPEIIKHGFNGWLFNPQDDQDFLNILEKLLGQSDLVSVAADNAVENQNGLSFNDYAASLVKLGQGNNLA